MPTIASGKTAEAEMKPFRPGGQARQMPTTEPRVEEWTLRAIRAGACLVISARLYNLYQLYSDPVPHVALITGMVLVALFLCTAALGATYTPRAYPWWKEIVLVFAALSILTQVVVSVSTDIVELALVSLL